MGDARIGSHSGSLATTVASQPHTNTPSDITHTRITTPVPSVATELRGTLDP